MEERLQKIISEAGIASRRGAEKLITEGKVAVNGVTVTKLGTKADKEKDSITVDGRKIKIKSEKLYIILNKPINYVTTMNDPEGRKIVTDLMKGVSERVYPVGRLDYDSSGLLVLTNDGSIANKLMHPHHEVLKQYRVKVRGVLSEDKLTRLRRKNAELGFRAPREVRVEPVSKKEGATKHSWLVITISEGKNRQIRRMIESVGGTVLKLTRISLGKLTINGLRVGAYRHMSNKEVDYLKGL